jgi:hypothetical protein
MTIFGDVESVVLTTTDWTPTPPRRNTSALLCTSAGTAYVDMVGVLPGQPGRLGFPLPMAVNQVLEVQVLKVHKVANAAVAGILAPLSASMFGAAGTLNGLTLILNVDGAGALTLNLSGAGNTATQAAFLAAITAEWATLTATTNSAGALLLSDSSVGAAGSIVIGAGTANSVLGLAQGTTTGGTTTGSFDALY